MFLYKGSVEPTTVKPIVIESTTESLTSYIRNQVFGFTLINDSPVELRLYKVVDPTQPIFMYTISANVQSWEQTSALNEEWAIYTESNVPKYKFKMGAGKFKNAHTLIKVTQL